MIFTLSIGFRKVMIILIICTALVFSISQTAAAIDYNILTWDSFTPADGTKVTSSTVSFSVNASDWDSIAAGSMKLYIDNNQVPAQVTLTDGEGGGG